MYIEFKNNEKYPTKNADIADDPEAFHDCGYILKENDLVIDIDNVGKEVIKKIISLFGIKTQIVWTTRGAHFYFKKPKGFKGSKKVCPLGFEVEYKHAGNTQAITVKQGGKMRIFENENIREDLPSIFFTRKKLEPLLGLDENDGRNNALFAHRMKIHDLKEWQSVLRFINNNIFATPLTEDEFTQVAREGVKIEAKTNNEPEVSEYLLKKYKIVSYAGNLYWYEDEQYVTDDDRLKRLIFNEVGLMKTRYIDEIIKQMRYRATIIEAGTVFDIKLKNGILRNGEFIKVNYQDFTPYSIDIIYDPNTKPVKVVDDYINHLTVNDADYRKKLLEILAHPLIVDKEFKRMLAKFFIFVGNGGEGKGTLLLIIRRILGYSNCSALSIKNMTDERYFTTMQNKLVNLGDDVENEAINNEQMKSLKNISTCDFVATRNLFEQSKNIELTLSLIFTSNHILKSFEKNEAYKRRVDWLPIFKKPPRKDKNFISKITTPEALQYWLKLVVEGYFRLYKNEGFTHSDIVQAFNDKYHEENNTVLQYLNDQKKIDLIGLRSPEAHEKYKTWCEENGLTDQSRKLFIQSVEEQLGLIIKKKTINGVSARIFSEKE